MTMTRVAPRPVLSGDGRAGVVVRDGSAYLFQTAGGQIDRLATPAEAGLAALDRTGSRCVISGDDFLALWECGPPSRQLAAVRISAPLLRLAVDGDLVLGAVAAEDDRATLQAWQGDGLAAAPGWVALGPTAVDQLLLDGARGQGSPACAPPSRGSGRASSWRASTTCGPARGVRSGKARADPAAPTVFSSHSPAVRWAPTTGRR